MALGRYNAKKINYPGYKELAYLHPNVFKPNIDVVKEFNPNLEPYFILRLVSLKAYHDVGMKGLEDSKVLKLISMLENYGKVFITSERPLSEHFEKYRLTIEPAKIAHVLNYARIFIGDSQTMTSEAAVLGTPSFRCSDFVGKITVMEEKVVKYRLSFNYPPAKFDDMVLKIQELLDGEKFDMVFQERKRTMLKDKIDLSAFMIWLFENYFSIDFSKPMPFHKFK